MLVLAVHASWLDASMVQQYTVAEQGYIKMEGAT